MPRVKLPDSIFASDMEVKRVRQEKREAITRNKPSKYEFIPIQNLGLGHLFFVLKSRHPYLNIEVDDGDERDKDTTKIKYPRVTIIHTKTYKEPKTHRLIEYYRIKVWTTIDKTNNVRLRKLIETIELKLWKTRLPNEEFMTTHEVNGLRETTLNVYIKTSLMLENRNFTRRKNVTTN